jgi:hypothetical protein
MNKANIRTLTAENVFSLNDGVQNLRLLGRQLGRENDVIATVYEQGTYVGLPQVLTCPETVHQLACTREKNLAQATSG